MLDHEDGSHKMMTPEGKARVNIDPMLEQAGWVVQDREDMNLYAGTGVAVRGGIYTARGGGG